MPTHQRFRLDNPHNLQDRRTPTIHLEEEPAIVVRERGPDGNLTPENDQLMSENRILRLKPALRLERRGKDGQNETEQPDHSASLGDSITSSTRIRFSVHTGPGLRPHTIRPPSRIAAGPAPGMRTASIGNSAAAPAAGAPGSVA